MFQAEWIDRNLYKGLVVNFLPSWWYNQYGISWGERMFYDPDYRVAMDREVRRLLAERFSVLPIGSHDPQPRVVQPTLNNALTPAYYGCDVIFPEDKYAQWHHICCTDKILAQQHEHLQDVFPFCEIDRQTRYLNGKLGTDDRPVMPPMGVLNNAVQLMGDQILGDLLDVPDDADRILAALSRHEQTKLHRNLDIGWNGVWYLFNCSVDMIGPDLYRQAILPHDAAIANAARTRGCRLHLHHCGRFDAFQESYKGLGKLFSLEVGYTSDPAQAASYPLDGGPLYVILDHKVLSYGTADDVRHHMRHMIDRAGQNRNNLVLLALDLENGTPDANVAALFEEDWPVGEGGST